MPNMELELRTLRARATCPSDWASQVPQNGVSQLFKLLLCRISFMNCLFTFFAQSLIFSLLIFRSSVLIKILILCYMDYSHPGQWRVLFIIQKTLNYGHLFSFMVWMLEVLCKKSIPSLNYSCVFPSYDFQVLLFTFVLKNLYGIYHCVCCEVEI